MMTLMNTHTRMTQYRLINKVIDRNSNKSFQFIAKKENQFNSQSREK